MTAPLRDLLRQRADRGDHVDAQGVLAAVHDLADRRPGRRRTVYAATGACVAVTAVVAGSLALAAGGAGHQAEQSGGSPVSPVQVPAATATTTTETGTVRGPRGALLQLPAPTATTAVPGSVASSALLPQTSEPAPAYTSTLSILFDAPPAPADAPVSLGLLPKGWVYEGIARAVPGHAAAVRYGPIGQPAAIEVWVTPPDEYVMASPASTAGAGGYVSQPPVLRAGDAVGRVTASKAMVTLEVLDPDGLSYQSVNQMLDSATVR